MSRLKEQMFERGSADSYNVCEWASIDRLERGRRGGNIAALRAAVAAQAILTFDEALQVANDTEFGLSSSIFTNDAARIFRFVDEIETGMTHINSPTTGGEAHIPFGGSKGTGIGDREQGSTALDFYTELKVVYVDYTGRKREGNLY